MTAPSNDAGDATVGASPNDAGDASPEASSNDAADASSASSNDAADAGMVTSDDAGDGSTGASSNDAGDANPGLSSNDAGDATPGSSSNDAGDASSVSSNDAGDAGSPTYQIAISGDGYETPVPSGNITVQAGAQQSFTLILANGYSPGPVSGTCPAIASPWTGQVYTTGAITGDCTVIFSAVPTTCTQQPSLCDAHATCNVGSCACANGYSGAGTPGTCKATLGISCGTSADCAGGLGCGSDHLCGGTGAACTSSNADHSSGACVHDYCPASQCASYANPCATNRGGCDLNATCADNAGMAQCSCNSGYVGSGTTCIVFVNACAAMPNPCGAHGICQMLPNSNYYQCSCPTGYLLVSNACVLDYASDLDVCDATGMSQGYWALLSGHEVEVTRTLGATGTLTAVAFPLYKFLNDYSGTLTLTVSRSDGQGGWVVLGSSLPMDAMTIPVQGNVAPVNCNAPVNVFDLSAQPIAVSASDVVKLALTSTVTSASGDINFGLATLPSGQMYADGSLQNGVTLSDAVYVIR